MKNIVSLILVLLYSIPSFSQDPGVIHQKQPIPFEVFSHFHRYEPGNPLIEVIRPEWAAAAHAIVVGDTVHYLWSKRDKDNYWDLRHSWALVEDPSQITHDPRNPILTPPPAGMDSKSIEYPNPFYSPLEDRYYMYYLVKEDGPGLNPKQTGLLVSNGDLGIWERVVNEPVIKSEFDYEKLVAGHTGVAVVGDTIHIIYTAFESWEDYHPAICHATAPLNDPKSVTKNPDNPVFQSSGEEWDIVGAREAELFKGPVYFHIFYGGRNRDGLYQIGHVRTKDFQTFEPNPYNPIFTPATDPDAWDSGGLLTPQVLEIGDYYYMLYAGCNYNSAGDRQFLSGLARVKKKP